MATPSRSCDGPSRRSPVRESGILFRLALVALLLVALVGSLRWAMDVTRANARQVSRNLSRIRNQFEQPVTQPGVRSVIPGPIIEPEEPPARPVRELRRTP
ncbi:MAG: hypothetical protein RMJ43_12855 [Chloroherpetonaceae bacterium]|nr:hypothetical protein [Chthonomonadaceae bacterium]MDW8208719.1 hypothetical protein [Chloroherpetonaceae bacterium]